MPNHPEFRRSAQDLPEPTPIFAQRLVQKCHIVLPDTPKPIGAIFYEGFFYSYVRFYTDTEAARRGAQRSAEHGNKVVLTRVPKGLVLWVLEPDARPSNKSFAR